MLLRHLALAALTAELSEQQEQRFNLDIHQTTYWQSSYNNDSIRIVYANKLLTHGL